MKPEKVVRHWQCPTTRFPSVMPGNMDILCDRARPPKDKWLGPGPHGNVMTADFVEYQRRVIAFLDKARSSKHDN